MYLELVCLSIYLALTFSHLFSTCHFPDTFPFHFCNKSSVTHKNINNNNKKKRWNKHNPSFYLCSSSLHSLSALDLSRPFSPSSITEREETCYVVSFMEISLVALTLHLLRLQGRTDNWFAVMANCSWSLGTEVEGWACLAKDGLQVSLRAL